MPADFDYDCTHDLYSLARFVRAVLGLRGPASIVSTACSSSAKAFGEAAELIAAGVCDAAVVGGADSLCGMTLYGFAALELLADQPTRPFAEDRAGISIAEAAQVRVELASSDLIRYMLNQRTGCMGPNGEDIEQEAEDFAALLLYRLGRLPSDRSSIVQVRLGEAFG